MTLLPDWLTEQSISRELEAMLRNRSPESLETMAARSRAMTLRRFGRTMTLYAPLYLSNYCSSGCAYCGFASDRTTPPRKLDEEEIRREIAAMKQLGIQDILLLTGERTATVGFEYLRRAVEIAAESMQRVTVEAFPMSVEEYRELADCGCTGITIYQETYDSMQYEALHRWGPKKDYLYRLETPERALEGGIKTIGLGVLFGLSDPVTDALMLYRHARHLEKNTGAEASPFLFPAYGRKTGGYEPAFEVDDHLLARIILAFRITMPDVELVLSTREKPSFRDGMAGLAITRMSIASRTTVGGYLEGESPDEGQFEISDSRTTEEFCQALRNRRIEPIFKNWEPAYNGPSHQTRPCS